MGPGHATPRRAGPHTQALPRLLTLGFQGPERTCQDRDRPITPEPMKSPAAPEVAGATCGGPEGAAKLTLEQGAIRCPTGDTAVPKFSRDVAQTTQNLHTHKWLHGCPRHFSAGLLPSLLAGGAASPKAARSARGRLPVLRKPRLLPLATEVMATCLGVRWNQNRAFKAVAPGSVLTVKGRGAR